MANVTFSRKEFEKLLGKRIDKKIEEKISMFGTPLESLNSEDVEIEIFPNRPDLLSLQGYMRSFKAFLGKESGLKKYKVKKSGHKVFVDKSLTGEYHHAYACIVKGLNLNDAKIKEIIQLQEKLGSTMLRNRKKGGIGLYPLEKITFPVTFKGMDPNKIRFRPLEYAKEISGRQVLTRHPTGRTYAHLVKGWDKFPVFVDKKGIIMSMPPIINSHTVGRIDEKTKDVFVEITGTDEQVLKNALLIVVTTLADMGGTIHSIECATRDRQREEVPMFKSKKMKLSIPNCNRLLGVALKEKDVERLLKKMGYEYKNKTVFVPPWRVDVLHEVDIIEDLGIAYGYDSFKAEIPKVATIGKESSKSRIKQKIAELLAGRGLLEVSSYHLIKQDEAERLNSKEVIELEDSKTEYKVLRPNLLIPTVRILSENKDSEYPQNVFEIGTVFSVDPREETGIKEKESLLIALTPGNVTEAKQILDYISSMVDVKCFIRPVKQQPFIEGRTGGIMLGKKQIGVCGEVHPNVLKTWGLKMPLAIIELDLDELINQMDQ